MEKTLPNYEILNEVGTGGMSTVYKAFDTKLQRTVAIKALHPHLCKDPSATERFKREALAAAQMDHPNIVRIYDYMTDRDTHYIIMQYVPGCDMESVVQRRGKLDFGSVMFVMTEIGKALKEAHARTIIHRDVKPANILLHRNGQVMLSDFGLAHRHLLQRLTVGDMIVGTPLFMSPEQMSGGEITVSSDVYSWAVTFYFLLTGTIPYRVQGFPEIVPEIQMGNIVMDRPEARALPGPIVDLLHRCLIVSAGKRIQTGGELVESLQKLARGKEFSVNVAECIGEASGSVPKPSSSGVSPTIQKTAVYTSSRPRRHIVNPAIVVIGTAYANG
jgi:serine/threonine-protein kinase